MPAKHRAVRPRRAPRLRSTVLATTTGPLALAALGTVAAPAAHAAPSVNWDAVAQCESSGNWAADTGNGFFGGLQFTKSTWKAFGGSGDPQDASRSEQIAVAEKVLDGQGIGAWPVCGKHGLSGGSSGSDSDASSSSSSSSSSTSTGSHSSDDSGSSSAGSGSSTTTRSTPRHATADHYTVVAGDTLSSIASRHGVEGGWRALAAANPDLATRPDMILPGQLLDLPDAAPAT